MKKTRFQKQNEYRQYIARIRARYGAGVDCCDEGLSGWSIYREVREPGMFGGRMKVIWTGHHLANALR